MVELLQKSLLFLNYCSHDQGKFAHLRGGWHHWEIANEVGYTELCNIVQHYCQVSEVSLTLVSLPNRLGTTHSKHRWVSWQWGVSKKQENGHGRRARPTRGTELRQGPPPPGGLPVPLPPPWEVVRQACAASPGGRWYESGLCTCVAGWWCASHCGDCLAWSRREHPPWSSPGTCREKHGTVMKRGRDKEALPISDHQWGLFPCCDKQLTQPNTKEESGKWEERLESGTMRAQPWQFIHGGVWYGLSCDSISMSERYSDKSLYKPFEPYLLLINDIQTNMAYQLKFFANCQGGSLTTSKSGHLCYWKKSIFKLFAVLYQNQERKNKSWPVSILKHRCLWWVL